MVKQEWSGINWLMILAAIALIAAGGVSAGTTTVAGIALLMAAFAVKIK